MASLSSTSSETSRAWDSLQPKNETGAYQFISETKHNGSNIVVAILDTGVDPGVAGLLKCPDGKPKVIDIIDCTGSGDVQTKTEVEASIEGELKTVSGLSGRKLLINNAWVNPSGKWRLGVKRAFELFPGPLTKRIKEERKKIWVTKVHDAQVNLKQKIVDVETSDKKLSKDYEERLEVLTSIDKAYDDPGPMYDVIVWNDGSEWCACVDSTETGDMSSSKAMRSYRVAQEYGTFSDKDNLNYSVTIFDDGNVCSVCTDVGSHGTHVAGIVAAYHEDNPQLNGVAPGAQIVSFKIGDSRLGSMETGIGLMRALIECVKHKVDVINMSYGEACSLPDKGRFIELANEVVHKHGIVFVSSAGNNGPAISTVGAPGGTSSAIIGVAAMVSPAMMLDQYSISEGSSIRSPVSAANADGVSFTWSSRGPAPDGDMGVSITAPGAAISPVPTWNLQANQLMNGTSMSSPNAAGCVALLLSAAKADKLNMSPNILRRGLENSCKVLDGSPMVYAGHGLVNVPAAYKWLSTFAASTPDCHFDISVNDGRGIYLRGTEETNFVSTHNVFVKPVYHEDTPPDVKTALDLKITFKSSASWLKFPDRLSMNHGGRGFNVIVDPTKLAPGLHAATVIACQDNSDDEGALFEVCVTIAKPEANVVSLNTGVTLSLEPGIIQRSFLTPPRGATWCDVIVTDKRNSNNGSGGKEDADGRLVVVHLLQLAPKQPYELFEKQQYLRLRPGQTKTTSIAVIPNSSSPLEVCIGQFWSSPGTSQVQLQVNFRGVDVNPSEIVAGGTGNVPLIKFSANLQAEEVEPSAKLHTWRKQLLPTSAKISPLGDRDVLPNGKRCYELLLEYTYTSDGACAITPNAPLLNGFIYDSPFDSQLVMVFDDNKQLLGTCDAWPSRTPVSLKKKGKHTLRYTVRHETLSMLEALKKMSIFVERKLKDEISMPLCAHSAEVATGGTGGTGASILLAGRSRSFVLGNISFDKLPKGAVPGDVLLGTLQCVKKVQDLSRPGGWPITYVVPLTPADDDSSSTADSSKREKSDDALMADLGTQVEKLKIQSLTKFSKDSKDELWEKLYANICSESPENKHSLALRQAKLHHCDREATRSANLSSVIEAADTLLNDLNLLELSSKLGLRASDDDEEEAKAERKKLEEEKVFVIDALARKCRALLDSSDDREADFMECFKLLQQWEDVTASKNVGKYGRLVLGFYSKNNKLGFLLKYTNECIDDATKLENDASLDKLLREVRAQMMQQVGWGFMEKHDASWALISKPSSFTLF